MPGGSRVPVPVFTRAEGAELTFRLCGFFLFVFVGVEVGKRMRY